MRWSAALATLALFTAGCASPFNPPTSSPLPEVRANFAVVPYDSDGNGQTDGIQVTLRTAQPQPPLVGSDVIIDRNGDTNVTVWRCAQREPLRCGGEGNRGILSWDVGESIYIRGLPGPNRLNFQVRERFVYNTTVRVNETRDTEVWAAFVVRPYDSNGNRTNDGLEINLINSDKAPFRNDEVRVLINQVEQTTFTDGGRIVEFTSGGSFIRGSRLFSDGFPGENRVTVFVKATRYDLGSYVLGE